MGRPRSRWLPPGAQISPEFYSDFYNPNKRFGIPVTLTEALTYRFWEMPEIPSKKRIKLLTVFRMKMYIWTNYFSLIFNFLFASLQFKLSLSFNLSMYAITIFSVSDLGRNLSDPNQEDAGYGSGQIKDIIYILYLFC